MQLPDGTDEAIHTTVMRLRQRFQSGETRSVAFRRRQLEVLAAAISSFEEDLLDALREDLGKPRADAYLSEIAFVQSDIHHALRHLTRWTRPRRKSTPLITWPASGRVIPEPYGTVLIIGPWNYPFQLLFTPLVGAIAAGNCVCLKPSEMAPRTSAVMSRLIEKTFSGDYVTAVEGGRETVQSLIAEGFDYLFFTGSTEVGREIMKAAAPHLTPVTLELGGKSPCIVCRDAKIDQAARRIAWGKFLNAGQTCVAPDFVWVDAAVRDELVAALKQSLVDFYGAAPRESPDYGRIVNERHFHRLRGYLGQGTIIHGGEHDAEERYIAPTLLTEVDPAAPVMQEEIFGPILPLVDFQNLEEIIDSLNGAPKPLAMYIFTRDSGTERRIVQETTSGGVCVNDTLSQIFGKNLPFGGVGASGMGAYHGRASFDTFSHCRSILHRATWLDPSFRYPPVKVSLRFLRRIGILLFRK